MRILTCIVCPKGCTLTVEADKKEVTGHGCSRGKDYALAEVVNPTRVLTTTVAIDNPDHRRLPVKTSAPIPKGKLPEAMQTLETIRVASPVRIGDVIVSNILGTGIDLVACADM